MNRSSIAMLKSWLAALPNLFGRINDVLYSPLGQQLQLNRPSAIAFMVWPALWGFLAVPGFSFGRFLSLIVLVVCLRLIALLLTTPPQLDDDAEPMETHPGWLVGFGVIALWLAVMLGPVTIGLTLLWGAGLAVTPFFSRHSWTPQLLAGLLFGVWPVLFGLAAAQAMDLSALFIIPAAYGWALAVEIVRAEGSMGIDLTYGIKSLPQWLGSQQLPLLASLLVITLLLLLLAASVGAWHGLYHVGVAGAQGLWTLAWVLSRSRDSASTRRAYRWLVWGGAAVAIGLLFS